VGRTEVSGVFGVDPAVEPSHEDAADEDEETASAIVNKPKLMSGTAALCLFSPASFCRT